MSAPAPANRRTQLLRGGLALAVLALTAIAVMTAWFGLRATLGGIERGLPAVPFAILINAAQMTACGFAWGALLPVRLPAWQLVRARWLREAVNSVLPVASLGGSVVGARLLARTRRLAVPTAAASAAADITGEAIAQLGFLALGLLLASTLPHAPFKPLWVAAPLLGMVAGLIGAQAAGIFGWLERTAQRLLPARFARPLQGLQARLHAIYAERRRFAADIGFNFIGWSIGSAEVWLLLHTIGDTVPWRVAYAIEAMGLVARSIGFALPAGLAAQETGFVLAAALFGVPHDAGLALSLLKRVRELIMGVAGVVYWQWLER